MKPSASLPPFILGRNKPAASKTSRQNCRHQLRRALGVAAVVWSAAWSPSVRAQIYVADGNLNGGNGGVAVFAQAATGNVLPDMTLVGANTTLNNVKGAVASSTNVFVLCNNFIDPPFIKKFSLPTSGNAAPVSTTYLAPSTGSYDFPAALAIDGTNLYVLDNGTGISPALGAVNVYPLSSLTSNTSGSPLAATRTITGVTNTGLNRPNGLAVDSSFIYVANNLGNNLLIFALGASGDVAPSKTITGLNAPSSVAVDASTIYVFNFNTSRVTTYPVSTGGGAVAASTTIGSTSITTGAYYVGVDSSNVYVGDGGDPLGTPVPAVLAFPKATNNTSATPSSTIAGANALGSIASLCVLVPPGTAAPTVTASSGSTSFTTGGSAVPVDSGVTLTAVPSTLGTATIQITTGLQSAQDVLAFTNSNATTFGNIAGAYNVTLATLRLVSDGATATVAQWQSALRAVTYNNTAGSPNTGNRTVTTKVFDGAQTSTTATKTVAVASAPTAPGAPTIGTATAGNAQAAVTFTAPASTGGSAITGYTVTSSPAGGTDSYAGSTSLSHIVTGLTNGTAYTFTVTATNAAGTGAASAASNSVTPISVPGAPTIGTATAGNAQATVTFTAPASNGGSAITGYTVTSSPAGGTDSNAGTTGLSHVVTGLTNGTAYTFTVTATNTIGTSAASAASNSVTPLAATTTTASGTYAVNPTVSTFVASGLSAPRGLAFDVAGNLYVANYGANTISKVTPAGVVTTFVASGLNIPYGLAFDAAGNLYVANLTDNTVSKVTPAGVVTTFVASGLNGPYGLAFDAAGNLYVANNGDHTVSKVTPAGAVSTFVASGLYRPADLAFDAAGNLYVANYGFSTISKVTPAGVVTTFVASGLNGPYGLAFDAAGNLYVANYGRNTVSKVTPAGVVSTVVSSGLNVPAALAIDAAGNLYVSNFSGNTVSKVTNVSTATLTATIASTAGAVNTGTVTFTLLSGSTVVGTPVTSGTVASGTATVSYPLPANVTAGSYTIQAVYNAAGNFATSSDATQSLTVPASATTVAASAASATFSAANQTVALSAAVTSTGGTVNAGTVTFTLKNGSATIGTAVTSAAITAGTATASYTLPGGTAAGTYTIQAVYNAGGLFATSTDNTRSLSVFTSPTVASVTPPAAATYKAGDVLNFTVNFAPAVNVTGTPSFAVTIGSTARTATYVSGSGTSALTFRYTVALGDNASGGIAVASPIALNGGTINATSGGVAATLTFTPPTTTSVLVSTVPVLAASSGSTAFTAPDNLPVGSTAVAVDAAITVTDLSSTTLASATISITAGLQTAEDFLFFFNTSATTFGNISSSYAASTGVLTLTSSGATATLAQWQAALRLVGYFSSAITPNTANRTVSFTVNDGVQNSATVIKTVTVTAVNQTPVVTASSGATVFFVGATAIAVDSGLTVTDRNNATLATARITISNFQSGAEAVLFTSNSSTMGNIAGSYVTSGGVTALVLTFAGSTATVAQWQAALRSITYLATSAASSGDRTITFIVNDGTTDSAAATKTVTVTPPATIASVTAPASGTYAAGQALNFTVNFSSAVTVTGTPSFAITVGSTARTATYVSGSGTTALLFRYTVALGDNASSGIAIASPIALNGGTINGGGSVVAGLTFTPPTTNSILVSTVPILAASSGSTAFTAPDNLAVGSTAVAADAAITVTDPSVTTLASATVQITSGLQSSEDVLGFLNFGSAGNIVGSYNASTGLLTLTSAGATATVAQWQTALRSVFYFSSAITPNTTNRTVSFTVTDSASQSSNSVTKTVTVTAVNQTPVVTPGGGSSNFIATLGAITVDSSVTVSDRNNPTLVSATVSITGNFRSSEDVLAFANTSASTFGNIAATYNATTGVLALTSASATATVAQWQAALRAVIYNDTATSPNTTNRTLSFVVNDGTTNSTAATKTVTVVGSYSTTVAASAASANFSSSDQTVSLSATVTSSGGTVNAGTVTFTLLNSGTVVGKPVTSSAMTAGTATASYTLPGGAATGTYAVQAVYNASGSFATSSDTSQYLTVKAVSTSVATSAPAVTFGSTARTVTLTANVTSGGGTVNGGTVTFTLKNSSGATIGTAATSGTVTNGTATASYTLPAGTASGSYTIQAVYTAAGSFASSTVSSSSLTVGPVATTTTASGTFTYKTKVSTFVSSGLNTPGGLAFDAAGNLFVANFGGNTISKITKDGTVSTFVSSGLNGPLGLAFDAAGNLFVVNQNNDSVSKFTKDGTVSSFLSSGLGTPQFPAFDASGNFYVANLGLNTVSKVTKDGTVSTFVSSGLNNPSGLSFDAAGNLYVTNYLGNTISKVTKDGTVSTFASSSLFNAPVGLAFDASGNLYAGNTTSNTVSKVTKDGTVSMFVSSGLNNPEGLAFDASGNLFVGNAVDNTISKVTATGVVTLTATVASTGDTVNVGTVTFTLLNGSTVVGAPVTSGTVSAGTATVTYPLPVGTSATSYTIKAVYNPGGSFAASSDSTATLTPNFAQILQIFFGGFNTTASATSVANGSDRHARAAPATSSLAAVINPGGSTGKLVGYIASINAGFAVDIAINDDNTFSGQTKSLTSSTGTGQTLTFSGKIASGVMTGSVAELGLSFTANIDPDAGSSAASAGLYQASSLSAGGGTTYSIVGTQGQAFVLALTPSGVSAGLGTISASGSYTVSTAQGATIAGTVNTATGTTSATITSPTGSTVSVTGLSTAAPVVQRLSNLSILSSAGGGQNITAGFVVAGGSKSILTRGIGPGLSQFNVPGVQATPTLTLFDSTGKPVVTNNGWAGDTTLAAAFNQVGAFMLPATSRDAAATTTLSAGAYTIQVTGGTTGGRALAEIYDLDPAASPFTGNVINLSSLGPVAGSSNMMTAGFVVGGNTPSRVLIRGIGPSLTQFGVTGALATPLIKLFDGTQTVIAQNQAWGTPVTVGTAQTPATASEVVAAAVKAGAFPLATGSNDSSLVVNLAPGSYTVQLSGANNASGAALIEIYVVK